MAVKFFGMPSSSLFLVLSVAFSFTNALPWTGAQQTKVYSEAAWSPAPTELPDVSGSRSERISVGVNVCGWIGGISGAAAVCSAGSSCIYDTIHGVVGCCTTHGPCTKGVYTSCVDKNSVGWSLSAGIRMQNNGIYSCSGNSVCYRNTYPGGYYQYGCGASQDAASVETTYEGQASDVLLRVVFTGVNFSPFSSLANTTSSTSSSNATSSSSSSSPTSSSSSSYLSLTSSSSSSSSYLSNSTSRSSRSSRSKTSTGTFSIAAAGKATPASESSPTSTAVETSTERSEDKAAIAGAVIGAVVGLAALVGFAIWWGRRRRNKLNDHHAGPFITQHHKDTPPTSGPFQRIDPSSPDYSNGVSQNRSVTTITANDGGTNNIGGLPMPYPNAYASLPSPLSPPPTPPHIPSNHPGYKAGTFQAMYFPPPTASTLLVSQCDNNDFSRGYNDALPSDERDPHIHTDDPLGMTVTAPMLLRGGSGGSSAARKRNQDWGVTTEALRAQRPRTVSTPSPVPIQPSGWSPRGLSMRGHTSGNSFSGTGGAAIGGAEERDGDGNESPEWEVPPRSPLRRQTRRIDDAVPRYQLVDEVVGDDVPVLHSPGLRMGRGRKESVKE